MMNQSVSFQLGDWPEAYDFVGNDSITFGGNVESAFGGQLKKNKVLSDSSWMFTLNVQGIHYDGVRVPRNETMIYGSVDSLMYYIGLPKNDYLPLLK
jgi:hypothetical protein